MPVFEQGYRRYTGEKSTGSRALHIAWQNVRPRMRWWAWLLLLVLSIWPYFVYGVGIWLATAGAGLIESGSPIAPASTSQVAFDELQGNDFLSVFAALTSRPLILVWHVLDSASIQSVMFPAVVAAGLLASDRRTGALQIYFARPVSRLGYLTGKVLAAAFLVSLTTTIPTLALWAEQVAFTPVDSYTWETWVAPLVILLASALYALWSVALVLSLSSVMRRPAVVGIVAIGLILLLEAVGAILGHTLHQMEWTLLQPSHAIGALTAPLCGLSLPEWMSLPAALGLGLALPIALLSLVWWRLKAVEVST